MTVDIEVLEFWEDVDLARVVEYGFEVDEEGPQVLAGLELLLFLSNSLHESEDVHFTSDVLAEPGLGRVELIVAVV